MKCFTALGLLCGLVPTVACAQTVQDFIIDPAPPYAPLEKAIGYFTSTSVPSIIVGSSSSDGGPGGFYLYQSTSGTLAGPWSRSTIDPTDDAYERERAFTFPGDTYPGVVASRSGQLVWYWNPLNWGGDPTQPWPSSIINPNAGCHDIRIADLDGDGKQDIVCSSALLQGTRSFIAYQNAYDSWQIVSSPFNDPQGGGLGDSVSLVSIAGTPRINVVGATPNGVYWFANPGNRTGTWVPHLIGTGGSTNDLGETALVAVPYGGASDAVIVGSSEAPNGPWSPGLVAFFANADPTQLWATQSLDSTYQDIHEITALNIGGAPSFVVAEQEQASNVCNTDGYNDHPSVAGCRVEIFQYQGGSFSPTTELSNLGTHNQQYVDYDGGFAFVGANHDLYGAVDPALHIWFVTPGSTEAAGALPSGTYRISAGSVSVDGGFGYWGSIPSVALYANNSGACQRWTWNGSSFLNDCGDQGYGPWVGHYLGDAGNGTVDEPTGTPDTWSVTASGGEWTVQDNRTHNYLSAAGGVLSMTPAPSAWMIGAQ